MLGRYQHLTLPGSPRRPLQDTAHNFPEVNLRAPPVWSAIQLYGTFVNFLCPFEQATRSFRKLLAWRNGLGLSRGWASWQFTTAFCLSP